VVKDKDNKLTVMVSDAELRMLKDLAAEERVTASEVVRTLVRSAYAKRFKNKIPGADIVPTLRAILDDIAGPVHYTGGNIAERTGLPVPYLQDILESLERIGVVECIDHMKPLPNQPNAHKPQNWTWMVKMPRPKADAALAKAGFDPDADLTPKT
jgi:hypothetical protein